MNLPVIVRYIAIGLGLILTTSAVRAADVQLDDNVTWMSSAQESTIPASIAVTPSTDGRANSDGLAVQYRRLEFRLSEDVVETFRIRVYRYDTAEAIRDFGNITTYFDANSDAVKVNHALVVDSGGNIHLVEPGTVQILPSDVLDVFSDNKRALLPLTGLDVGATAIVIDTITRFRDRDIGPWGLSIYQQYGVPQERLEIDVSWTTPELRPEWHSDLEGMSCTVLSEKVACEGTDIAAYKTGESAYYDDIVPQFAVAEQRSWSDIQDWYRPLFESALTADASVSDMAAQLSAGLDDQMEILKSIHNFVAAEVRYVGLEHGDSAYVPHPTSTTLQRRYGDCKDKAALLIDLLHHVGIEMSPVLVSTNRRDPGKLVVPSRSYFDHLIICGTLTDGSEYCLDATDPYTGIDVLSGWIQGAVALPIVHGSDLVILPADEFRWIMQENMTFTLTEEGGLIENGAIAYAGTYGSSIRRRLSGLSSSELQDWGVADYHGAVSNLVDPSFTFTGIDETDTELTVSWDAEYEDLISTSEDLDYAEYPAWLNQAISGLRTDNKEFDYRFPGLQYHSKVAIHVGTKWRVKFTGPDIDMQSRFGNLRRTYKINGPTVNVTTSFLAPSGVIEVQDIDSFNRFLDIIKNEGLVRVMGTMSDSD